MKIGYIVYYTDGSKGLTGCWEVPHDSDYFMLNETGSNLGEDIIEEFARQKPTDVVRIEVLPINSDRWNRVKEDIMTNLQVEPEKLVEWIETPINTQPLYQNDRVELC